MFHPSFSYEHDLLLHDPDPEEKDIDGGRRILDCSAQSSENLARMSLEGAPDPESEEARSGSMRLLYLLEPASQDMLSTGLYDITSSHSATRAQQASKGKKQKAYNLPYSIDKRKQ